MKKTIVLLLALGLGGCQMPVNNFSGVGEILVKESTFDQSVEVTMTKTHNFSGDDYKALSTQFSAHWNKSTPEYFNLILEMHGSSDSQLYTRFERVMFNVDGDLFAFDAGENMYTDNGYSAFAQSVYTQTKSSVRIPYSTLDKILSAEDVNIRVITSQGYEDIVFNVADSGRFKYSKYYLLKFKSKVDTLI